MPSAAGAAASAAGAAAAVVICCGVLWQRQRARQRRVLMARETGARPKNADEEEEFAADWTELPRCVVEAQLKEAREELSAAQEELRELQEHRQAAARLKRESSKRHEASRRRSCSAEELRPAQEPAAGAWTQLRYESSSLGDLRYTTGLPIPLHAIGVVRSCYEDCQGTPRQPGLVPLARATIVLCAGISPAAFDGFVLHSHAWVIFVFHANTNGAKTLAARTSRGETFPAKIRPPRGQGRGQGGSRVKVGVLATRTPHRPNPVGLSLVRVESVDALKRTVTISGADVIDGSPVLDIKPYLPPYDAPLPGVKVFTPLEQWYGADVSPMREVLVGEAEQQQLHEAQGALRMFAGQPQLALDALRQTLAADVSRAAHPSRTYKLRFDGLVAEYTVGEGGATVVRRIEAALPDRALPDRPTRAEEAEAREASAGAAAALAAAGATAEGEAATRQAALGASGEPSPSPSPLLLPAAPPLPPLPPVACSEACAMSCERFREEHQRQGKPLKIVGGTDAWAARRWDVANLRARFAEREVLVRKRTDSAAYRLGQASAVERMAFGTYCDTLGTREGSSHYLAASNVRHLFPELREDFEEPRWLAANGRVHSGPFLWIASRGHYEFTHLDPDCGFLAVLSGRKRVRLWPSHLVHELYPNPLGADGRTIQSAVDLTLDAGALRARFPAFVPEAGTEVVLEAGDLLYIPAFTWHQVSSLEQSISINFFWGEQGRHAYVDKVLRVCPEAFFFWVLNVVEQNRTQPAFLQVLRHFDDAMRIFLKQQWAEELEERHLRLIRTRVFEHLMASRTEADAFYALGDIRQPKLLELGGSAKENDGACKAGRLKIRGLRSRGEVEFNGGRNAKRQTA